MIILLSGLSSAGKSSIAKAIKEISDRMWLQINIDNFWEMVHPKHLWVSNVYREKTPLVLRS